MNIPKNQPTKRFLSKREILERYDFLNNWIISNIIYNRERNGLSDVIRRVGNKVAFDVKLFDKWIDDHYFKRNTEVKQPIRKTYEKFRYLYDYDIKQENK